METKSSKKTSQRGVCCHYPGERAPRFLEPFLLLILSKKKAHGYEILQDLRNMGLEYESDDIGHVYRNLRKLERKGFLTSEWRTKNTGRQQRVYSINKEGKERLNEWYIAIKNIIRNLSYFLEEYEKGSKNGEI